MRKFGELHNAVNTVCTPIVVRCDRCSRFYTAAYDLAAHSVGVISAGAAHAKHAAPMLGTHASLSRVCSYVRSASRMDVCMTDTKASISQPAKDACVSMIQEEAARRHYETSETYFAYFEENLHTGQHLPEDNL